MGGNRIPKTQKRSRLEDPGHAKVNSILPIPERIVCSSQDVLLRLPINDLLGEAIDGKPLKWKAILAHRKISKKVDGGQVNYKFAFKRRDGNVHVPEMGDTVYESAIECRLDGAIRYVATFNRSVLSKYVFRIVESDIGRKQCESREWTDHENGIGGTRSRKKLDDHYFVIFHTRQGHPKETRKIGVVCYLSKDQLLLAPFFQTYYTQQKDYYILDCPR